MIFVGFALAIIVASAAMQLSGGSALMIFDVPSLAIVLGFVAGALIAGNMIKDFQKGWGYILQKKPSASRVELETCAMAFDLAYKASIASGVIGTIMGLIMMLVNLSDSQNIGPYLAVSIITILYGCILAFALFLPGKNILEKKAAGL